MGGHAFRQHLLERLTRADYDHVQARAHAALQRLFAGVRTPAPDPAKTTYGDVDFLVHSPFDQQLDDTRIAAALRAIEVVKGSPTSNLLVLIVDREPTRYAQIDVHRCEDEQCWDMVNLMHSYGRLALLGLVLGRCFAACGLWLGERGLFLQKPQHSRPAFLLTRHASEVLRACCLSTEVYKAGFNSRNALFDWLESGRIGDRQLADLWLSYPSDESDEFVSAWSAYCAVKADLQLSENDKNDVRQSLIGALGLRASFAAWQAEQDVVAGCQDAERARRFAISAEVKRRLVDSPLTGSARGDLARRIRADLEAAAGAVAW